MQMQLHTHDCSKTLQQPDQLPTMSDGSQGERSHPVIQIAGHVGEREVRHQVNFTVVVALVEHAHFIKGTNLQRKRGERSNGNK